MFLELLGGISVWFFWVFFLFHVWAFVGMSFQMYYLGKFPFGRLFMAVCSRVLCCLGKAETKDIPMTTVTNCIPDEEEAMNTPAPTDMENENVSETSRNVFEEIKHLKTATKDVIVWLVIVGMANLIVVLAVYYIKFKPAIESKETFHFGSYVLVLLAVNMILYFGFYLTMKWLYKEEFSGWFWFLFTLAMILWGAGGKCFMNSVTSWEKRAALSRELNRPCSFNDTHDYRHFLSAGALFFTFLVGFRSSTIILFNDNIYCVRLDLKFMISVYRALSSSTLNCWTHQMRKFRYFEGRGPILKLRPSTFTIIIHFHMSFYCA